MKHILAENYKRFFRQTLIKEDNPPQGYIDEEELFSELPDDVVESLQELDFGDYGDGLAEVYNDILENHKFVDFYISDVWFSEDSEPFFNIIYK